MNEDYKIHEDNEQQKYLEEAVYSDNGFGAYTTLTSCKHLSRRFIHSANAYFYQCHSDVEMDGCPKEENRSVADLRCFSCPFSFETGEDEEALDNADR